jgi:hypothetical protein
MFEYAKSEVSVDADAELWDDGEMTKKWHDSWLSSQVLRLSHSHLLLQLLSFRY